MNKSIALTLLSILLFSKISFAQGDKCGTQTLTEEFMSRLPWYGNNTYLEFYADSIGLFDVHRSIESSNLIPQEFNQAKYKIPVQFWIYRDSEGNDNGINERKVQELISTGSLASFIDNNNHLQLFKSAKEYENEGVDLVELTRKQQEQIEALVRYIITLNARINEK